MWWGQGAKPLVGFLRAKPLSFLAEFYILYIIFMILFFYFQFVPTVIVCIETKLYDIIYSENQTVLSFKEGIS